MFGDARRFGVAVAALLAAAAAGGACSPGRTIEAAGLLAEVARPEAPPAAGRREVRVGVDPPRRGEIYLPDRARAGLVVVPGAAEAALDDARLVGFAEALRRRGFVVLVPELAGEDALQVSAADAGAVADAVRYLAETGPFEEVGIAALSYAVGPAMLAALEEDVGERVGFVVAVGGYHDIVAAITYLTTGAFRDADGWRRAPVDAAAPWRFLLANAGRVGDARDARILREIAEARLTAPGADTRSLAASLGPGGQAVYRLLANRDPERVPELIAALPPRLRGEILALDLASRDLTGLEARLILIHGRADPLVPFTESLRLAAAVGPERARLFLIDGLDHVDLGRLGPGDLAALLGAVYQVLAERDAAVPPGPIPLPVGARVGALTPVRGDQ